MYIFRQDYLSIDMRLVVEYQDARCRQYACLVGVDSLDAIRSEVEIPGRTTRISGNMSWHEWPDVLLVTLTNTRPITGGETTLRLPKFEYGSTRAVSLMLYLALYTQRLGRSQTSAASTASSR